MRGPFACVSVYVPSPRLWSYLPLAAQVLFCSGDWDGKGAILFAMFDMSKRGALQLVGASVTCTPELRTFLV